jgi:predicted MFS family arabinose efflux permease
MGPTGIVALLGGAFANVLGYNGLFVIAGLLALSSAVCLIFAVREPRKLAVTSQFGGWETQ